MCGYMEPVAIDRGGYRSFGFRLGKLFHTGHDYNCPGGIAVRAVLNGIVVFSGELNGFGGWKPSKKGGVIMIRHADKKSKEFIAVYGHVKRLSKKGDTVKKGEIIGYISDYISDGLHLPHLHFCITPSSKRPLGRLGYVKDLKAWVNPKEYLEKNC